MGGIYKITKIETRQDSSGQTFTRITGGCPQGGYISDYNINITPYNDDPHKFCIDVHLELGIEPQDPSQVHAAVMGSFRHECNLGVLNHGKYVIRVNKNNDWILWINI